MCTMPRGNIVRSRGEWEWEGEEGEQIRNRTTPSNVHQNYNINVQSLNRMFLTLHTSLYQQHGR